MSEHRQASGNVAEKTPRSRQNPQNQPAGRDRPGQERQDMQYLPVPNLHGHRRSPAQLKYVILTGRDTGEPVLHFYIARDQSTPLASFTLTYRFTALPIMIPDPAAAFSRLIYDRAEINRHEYIVVKMRLDPHEPFMGCGAFVSAIAYADGRVEQYTFSDYSYTDEDMKTLGGAMQAAAAKSRQPARGNLPAGRSAAAISDRGGHASGMGGAQNGQRPPVPAREQPKQERIKIREGDYLAAYELEDEEDEPRSGTVGRILRLVLLGAALIAVVALVAVGVSFIRCQWVLSEVSPYLSEGAYAEAEQYAEGKLGKNNFFYNNQRNGMAATLNALCSEGRYNEAYRIVIATPFASLMQDVCEKGAEASLAAGQYKTAYEYAVSAPEPFDQDVAKRAMDGVFGADGLFNEDAYAVALKTKDESLLQKLLADTVPYAMEHKQYVVAMRAVLKLNDPDAVGHTAGEVFDLAVRSYVEAGEYDRAASYISAYRHLLPGGNDIAADLKEALINYYESNAHRDLYGALFLAKQFGMSADSAVVKAEDSDVRSDLRSFYFILSADQKRAYHQRTLALDSLCLTVQNGAVSGGKEGFAAPAEGKTVHSVYTGVFYSVLLYTDGTVSLWINSQNGNEAIKITAEEQKLVDQASVLTDVVSLDIGEEHIVFLHNDGSVTSIGENGAGQCDTGNWQKMVTVAAGNYFTVGLRSDGTLVACGSNAAGQCDVTDFRNVVDVRACGMTVVALFSDGTTGIIGEQSSGLAEVNKLTDVVRIRAGISAVIAETGDGRFRLYGGTVDGGSYGAVSSWSKITDFDCGRVTVAAIDSRGRVTNAGTNQSK